jgi:hypothetical protein
MKFNGANVEVLSNRVEPIFLSMNQSAAVEQARMLHVVPRNEIWTAIPCNGATLNNCIVVYDYVSDAFTIFDGIRPTALTLAGSTLMQRQVIFGDDNGRLYNVGSTLTGDSGQGITCLIRTRNIGDLGYSTEKLWRRLFLDVDVQSGASINPILLSFYANDGTTLAATLAMGQTMFQSRVDYGISAKNLSVEIAFTDAEAAFKLNGYTVAYRFQREV